MLIEQFICHSDNFGVLIHDEKSRQTAAIDAPDGNAILKALKVRGWTLNYVFITHHHGDHVEGISTLKAKTKAQIIGPEAEKNKIFGLDKTVKQGDTIAFGHENISVIETPGHTLGEVSYYLPTPKLVFTGDTLFSLGCGRLFEGTPAMMLESLRKLAELPDATKLYCGHEYTQSNARFALSIDPDNQALQHRASEVFALCAKGLVTLPSTIGQEKATNPFLRWNDTAIRRNLSLENASDETVFAEIRKRKDQF